MVEIKCGLLFNGVIRWIGKQDKRGMVILLKEFKDRLKCLKALAMVNNFECLAGDKVCILLPVCSAAGACSAGLSSALAPDELLCWLAVAVLSLLPPQPIFYVL